MQNKYTTFLEWKGWHGNLKKRQCRVDYRLDLLDKNHLVDMQQEIFSGLWAYSWMPRTKVL